MEWTDLAKQTLDQLTDLASKAGGAAWPLLVQYQIAEGIALILYALFWITVWAGVTKAAFRSTWKFLDDVSFNDWSKEQDRRDHAIVAFWFRFWTRVIVAVIALVLLGEQASSIYRGALKVVAPEASALVQLLPRKECK